MSPTGAADRDRPARDASHLDRRPRCPVREVRLPGRLTMQYVEHGPSDGVPVIALHGVTDSWRSFEPVLPHLPGTLRVFALTQRGHGGSEAPASGYALADFANDVVAFLDAQRLERAIIVGHSMGSANALQLAIDPPQRVAALALLGAFAGFRGNRELEAFRQNDINQLVGYQAPSTVGSGACRPSGRDLLVIQCWTRTPHLRSLAGTAPRPGGFDPRPGRSHLLQPFPRRTNTAKCRIQYSQVPEQPPAPRAASARASTDRLKPEVDNT